MKDKLLKDIEILICKNNLKEALRLTKINYRKHKDIYFLHQQLKILEKLKKNKDVITLLLKIIKLQSKDVFLIKKLAYKFFVNKQYKKAIKYYHMVVSLEPNNSENYYNLACAYDYYNKFKEAEYYYNCALVVNPRDINALNNLGLIKYTNKNYTSAIKIFKKAMSINSEHPEAYHHMGIINRDYLNDMELAILYLRKARRLDPKYFNNTYQLALTYQKAQNIEMAKFEFNNCLKLNSNHKESIKALKKLN